jgi:DNA-binding NarL/FixJ family response regulator
MVSDGVWDGLDALDEDATCVAFIGPSLQFSEQMLRIVRSEIEDVRLVRLRSAHAACILSPPPSLVIVHEALHDPISAIRTIQAGQPRARIAVAGCDRRKLGEIYHAVEGQLIGVIPINTEVDVWLSVLRLILCGHAYVPPDLMASVPAASLPHVLHTPSEPRAHFEAGTTSSEAALTRREAEILPMIAHGLRNTDIASRLGLSLHTVKLHNRNIFAKLGAANRTEAARWYLSHLEAHPKSLGRHDV